MAKLDSIATRMQDFLSETELAPSTRTKVRNALAKFGLVDPRALQMYTPSELADLVSGLSPDGAKQITDHAHDVYGRECVFMSLEDIEKMESTIRYTSTGSPKLDAIFGGGVPSRAFVELYGLPQMGKTQMCLSVAVNTIAQGRAVIWFDTEGAFRSSRFLRLAMFRGLSRSQVLANLYVVNAKDLHRIKKSLNQSSGIFAKQEVGLVVIDSLMNPFRSEYSGLGELGERQRELNKFLRRLKRLTEAFNVTVLYTNHVMAKIDPYSPGPSVIPVGGNVLGHASDIRVWLRFATRAERGDTKAIARTATVVDCGWLPEASATFTIGSFAVADLDKYDDLCKTCDEMSPNEAVILKSEATKNPATKRASRRSRKANPPAEVTA